MIRALLARVVIPEDGQLVQVGCVCYVIVVFFFSGEIEGSLPRSQDPVTGHCLKLEQKVKITL
jgi:hypothetical protein